MKALLLLFLALPVAHSPQASSPDCASWPTSMAMVHLKNAGITDPTKLDEQRTRATLLASEKVGKDLHRQVHDITFHEKAGDGMIEVITSSQASSVECSMGPVDVFVVSRHLGGE